MSIIKSVKVENMRSSSGREVPNQFEIRVRSVSPEQVAFDEVYFQSYKSIIARVVYGKNHSVTLDCNKWDYSVTTGTYRNMFLGEGIKETRKKIASGEYLLADLN